MRLGRYLLAEAKSEQTHEADINEIMFGYFLGGKKWGVFANQKEAKDQVERKQKLVDPENYGWQIGRAEQMAQVFLSWARSEGYTASIKKIWWTARAGTLSKAVKKVGKATPKHPADLLIEFSDGKFLGISAKSTKLKSGKITFKNPGVGTVTKALKIKPPLKEITDKLIKVTVENLDLPKAATKRKAYLADNPHLQLQVDTVGTRVLNLLRDQLLSAFQKMKEKTLKDYFVGSWMDAKDIVFPPYVKVTGKGRGKYSASLTNPLKDDRTSALINGKLSFYPRGNDTIAIMADEKRIMKARFKWGSGKLTSSLKMVVDPW